MNPPPSTPAPVQIQHKVLIVKPAIKMPGNTRTDESLTDEVHGNHSLRADAGRYVKQLYPKAALTPLTKIAGEARRWHKEHTLVSKFGDLLPTAMFESYDQHMKAFQNRFHGAVENFVADFPNIMDEARRMHNGTFRADFYPPQALVSQEFSFTIFTSPMARAHDVMVDHLAEHRVQQIREELEQAAAHAAQEATRQVMARILEKVEAITLRLGDDDAVFRDTLIGNLKDILDMAPAMNIAADPALSALISECRVKLLTAPATLRASVSARRTTCHRARDISKRFGAMGGRKLAA